MKNAPLMDRFFCLTYEVFQRQICKLLSVVGPDHMGLLCYVHLSISLNLLYTIYTIAISYIRHKEGLRIKLYSEFHSNSSDFI
jgi:hypothetical protein